MKNTNIRKCAECAVMIALATVLSYLTIFKAPYGGSVTAFSQVPIVIIGYRHGFKWGAITGVVYGVLQMLLQGLGNFAYVSGIGSYLILIFFDYILAFGVLGIAGAFFRGLFKSDRRLQPVALGISAVVASALRLLCHFISGVTIWDEYADGSVWIYSLAYNGFYMLFEGIITVVGIVALGLVLDFHSPNLTKKRA